jgi:hypothetical protein
MSFGMAGLLVLCKKPAMLALPLSQGRRVKQINEAILV